MKKIALVLADGFEEIEAVTVIDVLKRAGVSAEIFCIENTRVTGAHYITIEGDEIFNYYNVLDYDGVVFVGGLQNAETLSNNSAVIDLVNHYYKERKILGAICASPALLFSKSDLPNGLKITCYPSDDFISKLDRFEYVNKDVVIEENVVTSQSPSTALEFALSIVGMLGYNAEDVLNAMQGKSL